MYVLILSLSYSSKPYEELTKINYFTFVKVRLTERLYYGGLVVFLIYCGSKRQNCYFVRGAHFFSSMVWYILLTRNDLGRYKTKHHIITLSDVGCYVMWCGVMWCGVMWCGVMWCGVM